MRVLKKSTQVRRAIEGTTIGAWFVERYIGKGHYRTRCFCGVEKDIPSRSLLGGDTRSCGKQECKKIGAKIERPVKKDPGPKYE
jgi:hypothetical protein